MALWRAADALEGERTALIGGWLQYPYMGETLGTEVDYVGLPRGRGLTTPPEDCDDLAEVLAADDYDVVVAQQQAYGDNGEVGFLAGCLRQSDGATVVADTGAGLVVVFDPP